MYCRHEADTFIVPTFEFPKNAISIMLAQY